MTRTATLEALLIEGDVGEACRRLAAPLRVALLDRAARLRIAAHLVDDAVQETALRLLRHHGRFDPARGSAWTWVLTVAVRALIDLARRSRPLRPLFGPDNTMLIEPVAPPAPADPAEAEALVAAALAGLNPRHREAVRLRLDGVDQKSAGAAVGLSPGNVAVVYHHFRAKVRALATA